MNDSVGLFAAALNATNATDGTSGSSGTPVYGYLYLAIGLLGVCVNCVAFMVVRRRTIISGMATRWHLMNQCVCDGLCCLILSVKWMIGVQYTVPSDALGNFICMFWFNGRFFWFCEHVSLLNTMSLSIEYFLSVVHPVRHRRMYSKRNLVISMTVNWLFSFGFTSIGAVQSERVGDACQQRLVSPVALLLYGICCFLVNVALLPATAYCNIRIIVVLMKSTPLTAEQHKANSKERLARELIPTVVAMGCLLVVCIYPNSFYFCFSMMGLYSIDFQSWLYQFTEFLVNLHFVINPFIYVTRMRSFRRELTKMCRQKQQAPPFSSMTVATSDDTRTQSVSFAVSSQESELQHLPYGAEP